MTGILLILLILFFLGLPFYWIYKLISKKKKGNKTNVQNILKDESKFEASDLIKKTKFTFMDDYRMWTKLSEAERKERLNDIQVIFDYGKDHITG